MNTEGAVNSASSTLARDLQVDRISDQFETAWQSGDRPSLERFLESMPGPDSRHLFRELLAIEVSYRRDLGETPVAETYLYICPQYGDLIAEAIPAADTPATGVEFRPLPTVIGKYRVIGRLGLGGQAEIYRVVHPTLHHEMVLKLAATHACQGLDAGLLEAEGRLLVALEHPNIARVYDLGYEECRPYLVMEYIRGCNLRQHVRQQQPSWEQIAQWVAQVAHAVAAAHTVGVVHRDIKPDNVVMDSHGKPHLIDFGLAVIGDAWYETVLEPGTIAGTACYMAPEQARGDHVAIGPASDIFALGGLLYNLLTGRAPFEAPSADGAVQRAAACDFDSSRLQSTRAPRRLVAACLKAMELDPSKRYRSAVELAFELESCVSACRWWSRKPLVLTVMTSALLFVVFLANHLGSPSSLHDRGIPQTPLCSASQTDLNSSSASVPSVVEHPIVDTGPKWDKDARELRLAGRVVRRVRSIKVATNIVQILDAFEKAGWPPDVISPFPTSFDARHLKDAVASLNEGLEEMRFYVSADETRICWRPQSDMRQ